MSLEMHPRLSVSALSSWNWTLEQDLAYWAEEGITSVGIWADKLDSAGWDAGVDLVAASGLRIGNVISAGPFSLESPADWHHQRERLALLFETAEMLGAECVAITPGPAGGLDWNAAAAALSTALEPVLRQHHLPLAVEHAHSLRADLGFLHSLRDAIDFARQAGVTVCMECNACWAERDLLHTIETSVEYIGLVQVDDFVVGTRDTPNRVVPGDGDIDLRGIIHQLLEAGYQGSFDIEVVGPQIEAEGYPSAIRRSVRYLSDLLTDLGA